MAYVLTNLSPLSGQSSAGKRVRAQLKMGEHPGWTFLWLILWSEYVLAKLLYILNIEMMNSSVCLEINTHFIYLFIKHREPTGPSFPAALKCSLYLWICGKLAVWRASEFHMHMQSDVLCVSCNMCIHIFVSKNHKANNFRHFTCREFSEREND